MSADLVKKLRQMTQAGIKECSDALKENSNDLDQAAEYLRKKGLIKAVKKADREAKDGLEIALVSDDAMTGVLLELACETDFVARNENFQALGNNIAKQILEKAPTHVAKEDVPADASDAVTLLDMPADFDKGTVQEAVQGAIATIGENIAVRRFARFARNGNPGAVVSYIHHGSKLGVMVELESSNDGANTNPKVKELLTNICLHIAFAAPPFLSRDSVPAEALEKERAILFEQLANDKKPDNIKEKIVQGRLEKFVQESSLLDQVSITDQETTISDMVKRVGKEVGMELGIVRFVRFNLGA